jgi:hypothetical protein
MKKIYITLSEQFQHKILIASPIDWLYAACLEYVILFSIDSSEDRKQYDEYCLSIMKTVIYAHDRTHSIIWNIHMCNMHKSVEK